MSTRAEKVEAQRLAFESRNIHFRHLIGPVELEHLLLTHRDQSNERARFEAWISGFPYERAIIRFPDDPQKHGWPGQYVDIGTQLAWEAWQEALTTPNEHHTTTPKDPK